MDRRRQINEIAKRREKDFSDIKSSIEDRRFHHMEHRFKSNNTPKKSFVYKDIENNSLYS